MQSPQAGPWENSFRFLLRIATHGKIQQWMGGMGCNGNNSGRNPPNKQSMADSSASAVFRQLRAAPADPAAHAAQLALVRRLVHGGSEIHWQLPRKARARALLEWAAGRCAAREKDGWVRPFIECV